MTDKKAQAVQRALDELRAPEPDAPPTRGTFYDFVPKYPGLKFKCETQKASG